MSTWFLALHHCRPTFERIDVTGGYQTRRKSFSDQAALSESTKGRKAESDHRPAVAHDIGRQCDNAGGEPTRRHGRVTVARDLDRAFLNVDDAHGVGRGSGVVRAVQSLEAFGEISLQVFDILEADMDSQKMLAGRPGHGGPIVIRMGGD